MMEGQRDSRAAILGFLGMTRTVGTGGRWVKWTDLDRGFRDALSGGMNWTGEPW